MERACFARVQSCLCSSWWVFLRVKWLMKALTLSPCLFFESWKCSFIVQLSGKESQEERRLFGEPLSTLPYGKSSCASSLRCWKYLAFTALTVDVAGRRLVVTSPVLATPSLPARGARPASWALPLLKPSAHLCSRSQEICLGAKQNLLIFNLVDKLSTH